MKDIMAQIGETIGIKNNYRREHTKTQNIFYKDMSKININNKLKKNNEIKDEDRLIDEIECYLIDQHNFKEEVKENICLNSEIHSNISSRLLKNNENILFSDNVEDKYYKSKYNSPNTGKYDNNKRFISDIKHKNVTQNNPILNTHSIKRKFKEDNDLDIIMYLSYTSKYSVKLLSNDNCPLLETNIKRNSLTYFLMSSTLSKHLVTPSLEEHIKVLIDLKKLSIAFLSPLVVLNSKSLVLKLENVHIATRILKYSSFCKLPPFLCNTSDALLRSSEMA